MKNKSTESSYGHRTSPVLSLKSTDMSCKCSDLSYLLSQCFSFPLRQGLTVTQTGLELVIILPSNLDYRLNHQGRPVLSYQSPKRCNQNSPRKIHLCDKLCMGEQALFCAHFLYIYAHLCICDHAAPCGRPKTRTKIMTIQTSAHGQGSSLQSH